MTGQGSQRTPERTGSGSRKEREWPSQRLGLLGSSSFPSPSRRPLGGPPSAPHQPVHLGAAAAPCLRTRWESQACARLSSLPQRAQRQPGHHPHPRCEGCGQAQGRQGLDWVSCLRPSPRQIQVPCPPPAEIWGPGQERDTDGPCCALPGVGARPRESTGTERLCPCFQDFLPCPASPHPQVAQGAAMQGPGIPQGGSGAKRRTREKK